jgi:uncharacterized protein YkwD
MMHVNHPVSRDNRQERGPSLAGPQIVQSGPVRGACLLFLWLVLLLTAAFIGSATPLAARPAPLYLPLVSRVEPQMPLPPGVAHPYPGSCLAPAEVELGGLVNDYRTAHGLPPVTLSISLSQVAQWHVIDLKTHQPDTGTDARGLACNLHSWSDQGYWTPACYTFDHAYPEGMWFKPREITRNRYMGYGFENAAWGYGSPAAALEGWKNSPGHAQVILEQGPWDGHNWQSLGIGVYESYYVIWLGREVDPQGAIAACP